MVGYKFGDIGALRSQTFQSTPSDYVLGVDGAVTEEFCMSSVISRISV
eukprot:COSAG02_NODE_36_length_48934_cov_144.851029_36_plen_48_part_00